MKALLQTDSIDEVFEQAAAMSPLFAITRSAEGSVVISGKERFDQEAITIEAVVDTTGAGDAYTAGFIYAYSNDKSLQECARAGTLCATQVIQQVGARIERDALNAFDDDA